MYPTRGARAFAFGEDGWGEYAASKVHHIMTLANKSANLRSWHIEAWSPQSAGTTVRKTESYSILTKS